MADGRGDRLARSRGAAWIVDLALHIVVLLLVLGAVREAFGTDAAIVAGLLFPVTYVVGPLTVGIIGGEWLSFALQLVAIVGAVRLVGVPTIDREQQDSRSCLQVLVSTLLVVIVDLALHVAALALVIGAVDHEWGTQAAVVAVVLFPVTYLVGPLALAFTGVDWLPLLLQLTAIGLIGLLVVMSEA